MSIPLWNERQQKIEAQCDRTPVKTLYDFDLIELTRIYLFPHTLCSYAMQLSTQDTMHRVEDACSAVSCESEREKKNAFLCYVRSRTPLNARLLACGRCCLSAVHKRIWSYTPFRSLSCSDRFHLELFSGNQQLVCVLCF